MCVVNITLQCDVLIKWNMSLIPLFLVLNALHPVFYNFLFVSLITPEGSKYSPFLSTIVQEWRLNSRHMIISDCLAVLYLKMTIFTFGIRKMWCEELLAPSSSSSVPSDGEDSFTYIHTYIYIFIHRSIIHTSWIECGICHLTVFRYVAQPCSS